MMDLIIVGVQKAGTGLLAERGVDPKGKSRGCNLQPGLLEQLQGLCAKGADVLKAMGVGAPWPDRWEDSFLLAEQGSHA